jgi:hypothetical protein
MVHFTKKKTTEQFINEARIKHGNKYDYSESTYLNANSKVCIICQKHGKFNQIAISHINGKGCRECSAERTSIRCKSSRKSVIEHFIKIHNDRYDYSFVEYINNEVPVKIVCQKHGLFLQTPNNHKAGCGCPVCSSGNVSDMEKSWLDSLSLPNAPENRQVWIKISGKRIKVDGFDPVTNTIYEFWGDYWHGNPKTKNFTSINQKNKKSFAKLFEETEQRRKLILDAGYSLIDIWESDWIEVPRKIE